MEYTGIYATNDELDDLRRIADRGWQHGEMMIVTSIMQGILKDKTTIQGHEVCNRLALAHGLPKITGYYGITKNGEFVKI